MEDKSSSDAATHGSLSTALQAGLWVLHPEPQGRGWERLLILYQPVPGFHTLLTLGEELGNEKGLRCSSGPWEKGAGPAPVPRGSVEVGKGEEKWGHL